MVPTPGLAALSSTGLQDSPILSSELGEALFHHQGSSWVRACQVCLAALSSPARNSLQGEMG